MGVNYIGNVPVDGWQGTPEGVEMQLEVVSRGGLNGVDVFTLGSQGTQFQITSYEYVSDYPTALNRLDVYRAVINQGPQPLCVNGRVNSRYKYQVLHVQPIPERTRAIGLSSKGAGYGAIVACTWSMIAIPF